MIALYVKCLFSNINKYLLSVILLIKNMEGGQPPEEQQQMPMGQPGDPAYDE